jgi:hypothetical protein
MYYFISGILAALFFIHFFICNSEGEPPKYQISCDDFFINGSFYIGSRHIHHWLIFLILFMIFFPYYIFYPSNLGIFIMGFSMLMILHGLSYNDCFVF